MLLALTLLFFNPVLRGRTFSAVPSHQSTVYPWAATPGQPPDVYPHSDQADLNQPWQTYISDTLHKGSFPFWDPNSFGGGYPFFANGESAVLYPPRLITALLLSPTWAHDVFSMLHLFFAGFFMYLLMKELRVGLAGALLAAVAWMFAGFNVGWLHFEVVAPMSVFLPLDVLCIHRAFRTRRPAATVLAGLTLGFTVMSGHIILLGLVYLVAAAYAAALAGRRFLAGVMAKDWRRGIPEVLRLAAMVGISIGVAAVVIVPTALVLSQSQRDPLSYQRITNEFLAPLSTFRYAFMPPPLPINGERLLEMTFVGTITGFLAVVGFFVRRPGAWLGRVLFVVAVGIAVGTPLTWFAYHFVPGFKIFRPYSRLVVFTSFAIALLGGIGLDAIRRWARRLSLSAGGERRESTMARASVAVAMVSLLVVGFTAWQLESYGRKIVPPFVPRKAASLYPETPLITAVKQEVDRPGAWPGRIMPTLVVSAGADQPLTLILGRSVVTPPTTLFAADGLLFGLDSTGGYDSVVPRRVTALMRVLQGEDPETVLKEGLWLAYSPTYLSAASRFDLMSRLGITTVVATPKLSRTENLGSHADALGRGQLVYDGPDGRVLRFPGVRPGPYLVHGDDVVPTDDDALRRFIDPAFDAANSVVLERGELSRADQKPLQGEGSGRVLSTSRGVNSAEVELESSAPAWLVVPDSWAPGWSATLNGHGAPVLRANYTQRAVRVPAGRAQVKMRYRPPGLVAGVVLTVVTLLVCAAVVLSSRTRRRLPAARLDSGRGSGGAGDVDGDVQLAGDGGEGAADVRARTTAGARRRARRRASRR